MQFPRYTSEVITLFNVYKDDVFVGTAYSLYHPAKGDSDPIVVDNDGNKLPPAWYLLVAKSQYIALVDNKRMIH